MAVEEIFIVNQAEKFKKNYYLRTVNVICDYLFILVHTDDMFLRKERTPPSPPCLFWPAVLKENCMTQLKLKILDKMSSTILCLSVYLSVTQR